MTDKPSAEESPRENQRQTVSGTDSGIVSRAVSSRRGVLATLGLIGGSGVVLSRYGVDPWSSREDDSVSDDEELLFSREVRLRSQLHSNRHSMVPSFEYSPIAERFEDPGIPIERVAAEATPAGRGDRLVLVLERKQAQRFVEAMISFWTDADDSRPYSTTIDEASIEFDMFVGKNVSVGAAARTIPGTSEQTELLIARGYEEVTVEELLDTFDTFYDH